MFRRLGWRLRGRRYAVTSIGQRETGACFARGFLPCGDSIWRPKRRKSIIVRLSLGVYTVQLSGYRHRLNQRIIDFIINQF